jgi:hypothetical protein
LIPTIIIERSDVIMMIAPRKAMGRPCLTLGSLNSKTSKSDNDPDD